MPRGIYVVGTAARVGKTIVAGALAAAFARRGSRVAVMKPVQTGCPLRAAVAYGAAGAAGGGSGAVDGRDRGADAGPGKLAGPGAAASAGERVEGDLGVGGPLDQEQLEALERLARDVGPPPAAIMAGAPRELLVASDARELMRLAGCEASTDLVSPYLFAPALDPAAAARLAGVQIEADDILRSYRQLAAGAEMMVVEGACGLLSPLADGLLQPDLIAAMGLSALVVAPSSPHSTSPSLLAVEALRARGLPLAGVVLCRLERRPAVEEAISPYQIERSGGDIVRGVLPFLAASELAAPEVVARRCEVHLDVAAIDAATRRCVVDE